MNTLKEVTTVLTDLETILELRQKDAVIMNCVEWRRFKEALVWLRVNQHYDKEAELQKLLSFYHAIVAAFGDDNVVGRLTALQTMQQNLACLNDRLISSLHDTRLAATLTIGALILLVLIFIGLIISQSL